jgi:hypothetical protein
MAIKIGHASCGENKKIKGGSAGDQTSKEVCTRSWYNGGWQFVLRPKTSTLAEKSAKACEKGCANNNIGYDQNQRNTLYTQAKKVGYDLSKITTKCETDCSAFMTVCAITGGANIEYGSNGPTTSTMESKFSASEDYSVLTDSKYLTSDKYLKRGDILVKAGSHTVMVLENGSGVASASLYTRTQFIKDIQKCINARVDGKAGEETLSKTVTVSVDINRTHAVVRYIQKYLNSLGYDCGSVDGIAGAKFKKGVVKFQKAKGCVADGVITAKQKTWQKLLGMC